MSLAPRLLLPLLPSAAVALVACGDGLALPAPAVVDAPPPDGPPPAVIVMIGDGMGTAQLDAASLYRHGATGLLSMQGLPHRGVVRTGGPSGVTDSAAAATVMATGAYTWNGRVAVDRDGVAVETALERARDRGWATGVVTTTALPHATPAAFTAHGLGRGDYRGLARQQANRTRPHVMLGGGAAYFDRATVERLAHVGYAVVRDRAALDAAVAAGAPRLFGAFAPEHLTYVAERPADTGEPDLPALARAALTTLDRDADGFFLMIEGGRIDHGGHANDLVDSVAETLAFDDTVAQVAAWARARGNVTLLVTADHECGGLEIVAPRPAGEYPEVRWRRGAHTNARVAIFGEGPGTEVVDEAVVDHRWVHAVARARIDGDGFVVPGREPIPDGELGDLRHRAVTQVVSTGYGAGYNQLDALWLDATPRGLFVGVEGLVQWDANAVEVWLDVDPDAGTGAAGLAGVLGDRDGTADAVLAASSLSGPAVPGLRFGADLALVATAGAEAHVEDLHGGSGLRGLRAPYGAPDDLGWRHAAVNFGAVRVRDAALPPVPGQGLEAFVPWSELYPDGLPAGARVALAAVLVNSDGGHTSNQALPPFAPGTDNPGRVVTPLPGVVLYELDANRDGLVDGHAPPVVVR